MLRRIIWYLVVIGVVAAGVVFWFQFSATQVLGPVGGGPPVRDAQTGASEDGESLSVNESTEEAETSEPSAHNEQTTKEQAQPLFTTTREVMITNDTKHSIPLDEILEGGPGKDGIPSIDNPKFISIDEADFLEDESPGLGISIDGDVRFYPYQILVWHEIVNDTIGDEPVLVTYCPLCATGIAFERTIDDEPVEFGVSGKLWQSNLLMYNRGPAAEEESLWSQVLGEGVVGPRTGERLAVMDSDIVRFGKWKAAHPDTKVLSRDTGSSRAYGNDPYAGYYESDRVSFGAEFSDDRLHAKALVAGIEVDGQYKAYALEALRRGKTTDTFAGKEVIVTKDQVGRINITIDGVSWSHVSGFWFSWVAVHPNTDLFK